MIKNFLLISLLTISTVMAGLPPTTSKIDGDATKKTTFDYDFPIFSGTHTGTKVSVTGATNLPVSGDITLTNAKYASILVGKSLAELNSTGLLSGAVTAINANPALFDFGSGTGEVIDYATDPANPTITPVTWSSYTAVTVTNIATADKTYVLVNPDGTLYQQVTFPTQAERRAKIFAAVVVHPNRTTIQNITTLPDFTQGIGSQVYDFLDALGAFNVYGNFISPNGANLSLDKTVGQIFRRSTNYSIDDQNPHVTTQAAAVPKSLVKATRNAQVGSSVTVIDPLNYDVAGTVTLVPGGGSTSTIQRVYMFSSGLMFVQYGQTIYTSLSNAIAGISTDTFVINPSIADGGVLLAYIAVQKNCTALNAACSRILPAARFDAGAFGGSISVTTLQGAYNNSMTPQIITDATRGSVDFMRGTAADTDKVARILNGAGSEVAGFTGNGALNLSTALTIANGGTGQTTKAAAFDALSPMTTGGDVIYGGASGTGTRLANGTAGQFLKSNGGTAAPSWASTNNTSAILAKTGSYTLLASDQVVYWNTSGGTGIATLPTAIGNGGLTLTISVQVGGNILTINTTSSQTIGGEASGAITMKNTSDRLQVVSDGANWLVTIKTSGIPAVPGYQGLVDTFSVSYGTTNATTACSASPCSYLDQIGTAVTSITRSALGTYAINTSKTYSKLKCSATGEARIISSPQCSNCSSTTFVSQNTSTTADSFGTLICQGTY